MGNRLEVLFPFCFLMKVLSSGLLKKVSEVMKLRFRLLARISACGCYAGCLPYKRAQLRRKVGTNHQTVCPVVG